MYGCMPVLVWLIPSMAVCARVRPGGPGAGGRRFVLKACVELLVRLCWAFVEILLGNERDAGAH